MIDSDLLHDISISTPDSVLSFSLLRRSLCLRVCPVVCLDGCECACAYVVYQFHANGFDFGVLWNDTKLVLGESNQFHVYPELFTVYKFRFRYTLFLVQISRRSPKWIKTNQINACCLRWHLFRSLAIYFLSYCYLCVPYLLINVLFHVSGIVNACACGSAIQRHIYTHRRSTIRPQAMNIRMMISSVVSVAELAATTLIAFCNCAHTHTHRPASFAIHSP